MNTNQLEDEYLLQEVGRPQFSTPQSKRDTSKHTFLRPIPLALRPASAGGTLVRPVKRFFLQVNHLSSRLVSSSQVKKRERNALAQPHSAFGGHVGPNVSSRLEKLGAGDVGAASPAGSRYDQEEREDMQSKILALSERLRWGRPPGNETHYFSKEFQMTTVAPSVRIRCLNSTPLRNPPGKLNRQTELSLTGALSEKSALAEQARRPLLPLLSAPPPS